MLCGWLSALLGQLSFSCNCPITYRFLQPQVSFQPPMFEHHEKEVDVPLAQHLVCRCGGFGQVHGLLSIKPLTVHQAAPPLASRGRLFHVDDRALPVLLPSVSLVSRPPSPWLCRSPHPQHALEGLWYPVPSWLGGLQSWGTILGAKMFHSGSNSDPWLPLLCSLPAGSWRRGAVIHTGHKTCKGNHKWLCNMI